MSTHYERVIPQACVHYQVAGISAAAFGQIKESRPMKAKGGLLSIADYMDYSLVKADPQSPAPRDALNVCKLIGLNSDILAAIEREYEQSPLCMDK